MNNGGGITHGQGLPDDWRLISKERVLYFYSFSYSQLITFRGVTGTIVSSTNKHKQFKTIVKYNNSFGILNEVIVGSITRPDVTKTSDV